MLNFFSDQQSIHEWENLYTFVSNCRGNPVARKKKPNNLALKKSIDGKLFENGYLLYQICFYLIFRTPGWTKNNLIYAILTDCKGDNSFRKRLTAIAGTGGIGIFLSFFFSLLSFVFFFLSFFSFALPFRRSFPPSSFFTSLTQRKLWFSSTLLAWIAVFILLSKTQLPKHLMLAYTRHI